MSRAPKSPFFRALARAGALLPMLLVAVSLAQDDEPPLLSTLTLETALEHLAAVDAVIHKKLDDFQATANREQAEGRLTAEAAKHLDFWVKTLHKQPGTLFRTLFPPSIMPAGNEALMRGARTLEQAWSENAFRREVYAKLAKSKAEETIATLLRTAKSVEEIDAFLSTADRLKAVWPERVGVVISPARPPDPGLPEHRIALTKLRRVLEIQTSPSAPNVSVLASALAELRAAANKANPASHQANLKARFRDAIAPFTQAQDDAQAAVDRLFKGNKPMAEISVAIERLTTAVQNLRQIEKMAETDDSRRGSEALALYKLLTPTFTALEAGQYEEAAGHLQKLRKYTNYTEPGGYTEVLAAWDKTIAKNRADAAAKRAEAFWVRFAAIRKPAELGEVGNELSRQESEAQHGMDPGFPAGLGRQLVAVASAWASGNPALPSIYPPADTRFSAKLDALELRIQRDILATALRAPELNQPPLSDLPIGEALDKLNAQIAEKGAWRRLLATVEAREKFTEFGRVSRQDSDLARSLRAFLAAENFELSEQWRDASESYKVVLRSTSEAAPIKETATRVKKLWAEHFRPAAPKVAPTPTVK